MNSNHKALALHLWPVTDLARVVTKSAASEVKIMHVDGNRSFLLDAPAQARSEDVSKWPKNVVFAAYWGAAATSVAEEANMKIVEVTVDQWKFLVYTNHKKISKFGKLTYFDKALKKKEDEAAAKKQRIK